MTHAPSGENDDVVEENTLRGTISEFKDGNTKLGFEVTLSRAVITQAEGSVTGTTAAMFGDSGPGTGAWTAQLFGPDVDGDSSAREKNAFPTGVAGTFDAVTTETSNTANGVAYRYDSRVVGAFAAEEK